MPLHFDGLSGTGCRGSHWPYAGGELEDGDWPVQQAAFSHRLERATGLFQRDTVEGFIVINSG